MIHYLVMARFRSRMHPVQRIKHVVDKSATLAAGVTIGETLVVAVDAPILATPDQVVTGSTVHGIYLKVECASNEAQDVGAIPNVYMAVYKNVANDVGTLIPNAIGPNDKKRYVIHQEMVMIDNKLGGNPRILFNGVIKIPKGYSRFGPNDRLTITILAPALNIVYCLQAHYKEFR